MSLKANQNYFENKLPEQSRSGNISAGIQLPSTSEQTNNPCLLYGISQFSLHCIWHICPWVQPLHTRAPFDGGSGMVQSVSAMILCIASQLLDLCFPKLNFEMLLAQRQPVKNRYFIIINRTLEPQWQFSGMLTFGKSPFLLSLIYHEINISKISILWQKGLNPSHCHTAFPLMSKPQVMVSVPARG